MNIHCQCSRYIYPQAKQVIWEVLVIAINAPYCLCFVFVLAIMVTLIYACPSEIQCYFGYIVMTEKLYSMGLHLGIIRIKNPMKGSHVNPRLIHVNVWRKPLQYCKVISLQLIKLNEKKRVSILAVHLRTVETNTVWTFVPLKTSIRWPGTTISSSEVLSLEVNCFRIPWFLLKERSIFLGTYWEKKKNLLLNNK